ncbi:class I SAM-dependent methyltransferase [Aeromonas encheleia]|uniref:class I SAM-dependent methyltransferase n=1 Tax=Aeromonas encheleia TaxID=73010 RepID=UPI001F592417|nr:class I SAM-dependent methyltransferase [Aeromonas encheleia]UNP89903.1 class I SAM-dependent methyltransferase [Aeromonas encheleia]
MDSTQRFSARVEAYVKYRPGYPAAMLDFLAQELGMGPAAVVADIGAGTGILTALLAPRVSQLWAVEPNAEMRSAAERLLAGAGNLSWHSGSAEATGLPAGAVDLVTVAQAFHWFDRAAFKAECRRLLRPGGRVALIWNDRLTNTPFLEAYEAGLRTYSGDYEEVNHRNLGEADFRAFFEGDYRLDRFENRQLFDLDGVLGRLNSSSYAPAMGTPAYEGLTALIRREFARCAVDGQIAFNYCSLVYSGRV